MENSRNGDVKVTPEQVLFGRRRNCAFPTYVDLVQEAVEAGPARPLPSSTASRRRTYADGELDVFAAERYFKGAIDGDDKEAAAAVVVPVETAAAAARPAVSVSKPAWTSASAASTGSGTSANSQTVLLRDARRRLPGYRGKKCCLQVGVLLRSCSGKRAVGVDSGAATEAAGSGEPAASRIEWYRDLRMDNKAGLGLAGDGNHGVVAGLAPNLILGTARVAAIGREVTREEKAAEYTSASFRRNFTLLAPVKVSVPANGGGVDASVGRGGGNGDDNENDVGSESSSDLFEIKSLMIDDSPYEPSEASIQWSVVTASAGDVSVASERGGRVGSGRGSFGRGPVAVRQHWDRPVGLLTGCVSHRAVDVSAMAAVRRLPDAPAAVAMRRRIDEFQKAQNGPSDAVQGTTREKSMLKPREAMKEVISIWLPKKKVLHAPTREGVSPRGGGPCGHQVKRGKESPCDQAKEAHAVATSRRGEAHAAKPRRERGPCGHLSPTPHPLRPREAQDKLKKLELRESKSNYSI